MLLIYLLIPVALLGGLIIFPRLVLLISSQQGNFHLQLSIIGCGLAYHSQNGVGVILGRGSYYTKRPLQKKLKKEVEKITVEPKQAERKRKLSFSTGVKIAKAVLLFMARIAAETNMDRINLKLQPLGLNPALAGFSYGLNSALAGIWPGWGQSVSYQPFGALTDTESKYSGEMEFSIPNRKIFYISYQLWRDLPIWEITKTYMSGKKKKR